MELGYQSGDYVRLQLRSFDDKPFAEAELICKMRPDEAIEGHDIWWALNCLFGLVATQWCPVITVSCGPKGWILNETRTVWRDRKPWTWDEASKTWKQS